MNHGRMLNRWIINENWIYDILGWISKMNHEWILKRYIKNEYWIDKSWMNIECMNINEFEMNIKWMYVINDMEDSYKKASSCIKPSSFSV